MTANLCDWAMDRMSGYVAKELSANDDRKMRAHLQKCEKCRADKRLEVSLLKIAKGK